MFYELFHVHYVLHTFRQYRHHMAKEEISLGINCMFSYLFLPKGKKHLHKEFMFFTSFFLYDVGKKPQRNVPRFFCQKHTEQRQRSPGFLSYTQENNHTSPCIFFLKEIKVQWTGRATFQLKERKYCGFFYRTWLCFLNESKLNQVRLI